MTGVNSIEILRLWRMRCDTQAISARMGLPEHVVANALARVLDKGQAMSFTLACPLPPSVNSLFRNVPGRGRVKTGAYKSWRRVADSYALRQKPQGGFPKFERDFEVIVCVPSKMRGDVDNRGKATLDVLKVYGIISDDRHAVSVTVRRVLDMPGDECRVTIRAAVPEPMEAA